MEGEKSRRTRKIMKLFMIPLLAIMIIQSFITYGTIYFGGTFQTLKEFSVGRLEQVTETRRITIENNMNRQWSNISEEYDRAVLNLEEVLQEQGISMEEFLADDALQEKFLEELVPTWIYMMRKNVVTGSFLILGKPGIDETGGQVNAFYLKDEDATANAADYSDISMTRGHSQISKAFKIPFTPYWKQRLELKSAGERSADDFFYNPYLAAKETDLNYHNLGYWSNLFCLEGNIERDSARMITYSVPLRTSDGQVFGVMGIEISEKQIGEWLPYREVNSEQQGGYLLLKKMDETNYEVIYSTGPIVNRTIADQKILTLEKNKEENFYPSQGKTSEESIYLTLSPLNVYTTNTPFFENGIYLAGVENYTALFGFNDQLSRIFLIAAILSLTVGIIGLYLIVRYVTKPIRRLSECIRASKENVLQDFDLSHIAEVDDLYSALWNLTEQQKTTEYHLMQEKERYRVALESSSDILLTYDMDRDMAEFYNLDGQGDAREIVGLKNEIESGDFAHPADRAQILKILSEAKNEVDLSFRSKWFNTDRDYQWFEWRGRVLQGSEGESGILIGSLRNIHQQKMQEMEQFYYDGLTGLLHRSYGESLMKEVIRNGNGGCLLSLDVRGFLQINQNFGMMIADAVLEELGKILSAWKEEMDEENHIVLRFGGDEFLVWLNAYDATKATLAIKSLHQKISNIYPDDHFKIELAIGATAYEGERYDKLLKQARQALAYCKERGDQFYFYTDVPKEWLETYTELYRQNVIEHTSAIKMNNISLTFSFFDKSHDIKGILAALLPRISREYGVDSFVFSQVSRDFYTTQAMHWPATAIKKEDKKMERYSAADFIKLEKEVWRDNNGFCKTTAMTPEEREFIHAPKELEGVAFPFYDSGIYTGALLLMRQKDTPLWSSEVCSELYEIIKIIESNVNRARHDSASRAKSDFLSRMSHEIRTPMNAIIGMTLIAQTHKDNPDMVDRDLEKISHSSKYLLGLINDILDMSKIESGKMKLERSDFNLYDLMDRIDDLMRPQMEAKQIDFQTKLELQDPWVKGDSLHLNQIIINLLSNAVKFTPPGGKVITSVIQKEGNSYFFSVEDTGIGISPENATRIFLSFEQAEDSTARSFGGTGLGLAISSKLVRMMNGNIELKSELGKGSDFYFTISLKKGESILAKKEDSVDYSTLFVNKRILLVEDNELNVEIAKTILEMYEFTVEVAFNGLEATEYFAKNPLYWYDLILMDIHMPLMDGLEATKIIRQMKREDATKTPIIAMTANAFDEDMRKSVEGGMNGHLAKPIELKSFLKTLAHVLSKTKK